MGGDPLETATAGSRPGDSRHIRIGDVVCDAYTLRCVSIRGGDSRQ